MKRMMVTLMLMPMMALAGNDLYMIVDLSGGTTATSYPISYLADVPEGGWTDEYKTTKLVLRRIEPGTCVVTTDKPYYIGVFEMTQKQYEMITGTNPSHFSGNNKRPVEWVRYDVIRGGNKGAQYPASTDVDDDSCIGKLRMRTGLHFDLPTDVQWEYACRAGTTTIYSYGDIADGNYMWTCSNASATHDVGMLLPNPWKLYDMHGNVCEWCLDWYPDGSDSQRVLRGGGWRYEYTCASAERDKRYPYQRNNYYGLRMCCNDVKRTVETPSIKPNFELFAHASQEVTLSCETEGATIYYTVDGSEPSAANGRRYKGPFDIWQTTTVRAIAVKDDWKDSAVASATFTKENQLSEALNFLNILPDNDEDAPWTVDTGVSHDGVSSAKSGAIGHNDETGIQLSVKKAGRLSFWWRAQCEEPDPEEGPEGYYDYAALMIDGKDVAYLAGEDTGWQQFVTNITSGGKHVIRWEYRKDNATTTPPDCVWVDQVQWLSANATDETDHTLTTETPVPYT